MITEIEHHDGLDNLALEMGLLHLVFGFGTGDTFNAMVHLAAINAKVAESSTESSALAQQVAREVDALVSGLQFHDLATQLLDHVEKRAQAIESVATGLKNLGALPSIGLFEVRQAIEELLTRSEIAAERMAARSWVVSGGVACNAGLREAARKARLPYGVFFPTPALSTDKAAMIAAAALA